MREPPPQWLLPYDSIRRVRFVNTKTVQNPYLYNHDTNDVYTIIRTAIDVPQDEDLRTVERDQDPFYHSSPQAERSEIVDENSNDDSRNACDIASVVGTPMPNTPSEIGSKAISGGDNRINDNDEKLTMSVSGVIAAKCSGEMRVDVFVKSVPLDGKGVAIYSRVFLGEWNIPPGVRLVNDFDGDDPNRLLVVVDDGVDELPDIILDAGWDGASDYLSAATRDTNTMYSTEIIRFGDCETRDVADLMR